MTKAIFFTLIQIASLSFATTKTFTTVGGVAGVQCNATFTYEASEKSLSLSERKYECADGKSYTIPAMGFEVKDTAVLFNGKGVGAVTDSILKISNWSDSNEKENFSIVIYPMPGTHGTDVGDFWDAYRSGSQDPISFQGKIR